MDYLNRSVALVKVKQPYVEWANSFKDGAPVVTLDDLRAQGTAFLIPAFEYHREFQDFIEANYNIIFEHELAAWMVDENVWPTKRDYGTFREWFDVDVHEVVIDLGEGNIEVESYDA